MLIKACVSGSGHFRKKFTSWILPSFTARWRAVLLLLISWERRWFNTCEIEASAWPHSYRNFQHRKRSFTFSLMSLGMWKCYVAKGFSAFPAHELNHELHAHIVMWSNQGSYSRKRLTRPGRDHFGCVTVSDHTVVICVSRLTSKAKEYCGWCRILPGWKGKHLLPVEAVGKLVYRQLEIADWHHEARQQMKRRWRKELSLWHCGRSLHSAVGLNLRGGKTRTIVLYPFKYLAIFVSLLFNYNIHHPLKHVTFKIASFQVHSVLHTEDNLWNVTFRHQYQCILCVVKMWSAVWVWTEEEWKSKKW